MTKNKFTYEYEYNYFNQCFDIFCFAFVYVLWSLSLMSMNFGIICEISKSFLKQEHLYIS